MSFPYSVFQGLYHILCRCVIGCFSSFVCPLDLLHRFALSQLIHQLVQIADLLHQRFFDALQLYVADAALYEHPVRIELRSISKEISIQRSILHRSINLRNAVTSQPPNNFIYFCSRPPLAGCLFHQHRIYFCKWHGIYFFSFHFCPSLRCVYVQCITLPDKRMCAGASQMITLYLFSKYGICLSNDR